VTTLLQTILECVDNHLDHINSNDGSMSPGHNGPYHDPETPVRNTGHWIITFATAYEWTRDEKYRKAARRCADYLLSKPARPQGFSFYHRNGPKDHCNGLIGQAWTFEALAKAAMLFGDQKYAVLAEEVFFQHTFDEELGLWNRLEIDGNTLSYDMTFNHQLWFAACASLINANRRAEIQKRVTVFIDCLDRNLTVLPNGLVFHPIENLWKKNDPRQFTRSTQMKKSIRTWLNVLKYWELPAKKREKLVYKSIGYHVFNMYAFALLKQQIPDYPFWFSGKFCKMIDYMETFEYQEGIINNKYGYPYNPPGFEVPFLLYVLKGLSRNELIEQTKHWTGEQFRRCYNPKTGMMEKNTEDSKTHTARLYELMRLPREVLNAVDLELS